MKTNMNTRWRVVLVAAALSAAAGGAVAARSAELVDPGRMQIVALDESKPLTASDVRRAILLGGQSRTWNAVGEVPGVITLEIDNDQHRLVVDVAYDAQGFETRYKSSVNLNYKPGGARPTIHPTALRWINELNSAIRKAALAPREPAR